MTATVAQCMRILDRLAPPRDAEDWDNVGLQVGSGDWPVKKIWIALDPLPEVVASACDNDVDLLVCHHPLIFKPIHSIDCGSPLGRIIQMAVTRHLAIYSAHTNLDSVPGGVNDVLAERIGLRRLRVLGETGRSDMRKLVVFVPSTHVKAILDTLFDLDTGRIENTASGTFRVEGVGTYLAGGGASPSLGKKGILTEIQESRIEILVNSADLGRTMAAVKAVHPDASAMAYDVYAFDSRDGSAGGLGRVGVLPDPTTLRAFALHLKKVLNISTVKVVGQPDLSVSTVAVCSGSGASLLKAALHSRAQVYVSGDLGYHSAREAEQNGLALADIGHFGSERVIVDVLAASLRDASRAAGLAITVEAVGTEVDPFDYL